MTSTSFTLTLSTGEAISAEAYTPEKTEAVYIFAHGAGAGMNHVFMKELSRELAALNIATLRYNFLYMEQKKKRPDFPAVAHKAVEAAVTKAGEIFPKVPLFAGGKSFGGRMTSQYQAAHPSASLSGLIFTGFPLHPAGAPAVERADHLKKITIPMLFLQGTRDALAELSLIRKVTASLPLATLLELEGADHSFKAGKQNLLPVLANHIRTWITAQTKKRGPKPS